jgi:phosphoribosylamine--glycine ligase
MNILVIGSGGREHALAWKIGQSPRADRVFVAPGNAGTDLDGENVNIKPSDFAALIKFAQQNRVGLTVIGPEGPLALSMPSSRPACGFLPTPLRRGIGGQQGLLQGSAAPR